MENWYNSYSHICIYIDIIHIYIYIYTHSHNSHIYSLIYSHSHIHIYTFTTSALAKLSTCCFEHSGDISFSWLVNPSHTDESWEDETRVCGYIRSEFIHWALWRRLMRTIYFLFVHYKRFDKAQHLVFLALWWHQLFSIC